MQENRRTIDQKMLGKLIGLVSKEELLNILMLSAKITKDEEPQDQLKESLKNTFVGLQAKYNVCMINDHELNEELVMDAAYIIVVALVIIIKAIIESER